MRGERWSLSCTIYEVETPKAVLLGLLNDQSEDAFRARSAIVIGGVPRRAYKARESIDGASVKPFVVPNEFLPSELPIAGYQLTRYDDRAAAPPGEYRWADAIDQFAAFEAEARANVQSRDREKSDEISVHLGSWGCMPAAVPDGGDGLTKRRALREVIFQGEERYFAPLAMIGFALEPEGARGGSGEISFHSSSNVWSGAGSVLSERNDANRQMDFAAARLNAEWLAATLHSYLLASGGRRCWWVQHIEGASDLSTVIGQAVQARLGPEKTTLDIPTR